MREWKHGDVLILIGFPTCKVMFVSDGRVPGSFLGLMLTNRPPVFRKGKMDGFSKSYYELADDT